MALLTDLHYFEVDLGESAAETRPSLVAALHGFNARNGNALGLDFYGTRVRVFGEAPPLAAFFAQPRVQRLAALADAFRAPAAVPLATFPDGVTLLRHYKSSRLQPARQRRFERRNPGAVRHDAKPVRSDLALPMVSQSTDQAFLLKIARRAAPLSKEVTFNSYGLCTQGTSLPVF